MKGKTLQAQIRFKDNTINEFDIPLTGFAELFDEVFEINTCPMVTLQPLLAVKAESPKTEEVVRLEKGSQPSLEHLLADLNSLIGLETVKREVNSLVNLIKVREEA